MTEVVLPELGENVEKGDVVRLLVKVGDTIAVDQPLVELETDKATIEVPSTVAGKVTAVNVKPGDKVKVGQKLISVDTGAAEPAAKAERATKGEPAAKDVPKSPAAEAALTEKAEAPQEPPQPEPAPPQPAAASKPASKPAAVVNISSGRAAVAQAAAVAPVSPAGDIAAAPSVRRYARELGVNIADVRGSGPGGRIAIEDVTAYVKSVMTGGGARPGGAAVRQPPLPDFSKWGAIDVKPMSNIRRKTAEHLTAAWQAPHVTQHDKADVSAVEEFRKLQGSRVEKEGGKLTVTAIVIKIAALAIDKFPQFASSVDMANESIIYKNYCHIGVAVDTPNGLLVPVIRDVDKKSITEISIELATLSQKARDKKLSLDEMSGGVFSVTNLGGIGGTSFTPIVNMPEVAILGLSRTQTEPVWQNDQFVPKPMLPLSLSYDHRVIDGADAARFLRFVADALEQPLSLYL